MFKELETGIEGFKDDAEYGTKILPGKAKGLLLLKLISDQDNGNVISEKGVEFIPNDEIPLIDVLLNILIAEKDPILVDDEELPDIDKGTANIAGSNNEEVLKLELESKDPGIDAEEAKEPKIKLEGLIEKPILLTEEGIANNCELNIVLALKSESNEGKAGILLLNDDVKVEDELDDKIGADAIAGKEIEAGIVELDDKLDHAIGLKEKEGIKEDAPIRVEGIALNDVRLLDIEAKGKAQEEIPNEL